MVVQVYHKRTLINQSNVCVFLISEFRKSLSTIETVEKSKIGDRKFLGDSIKEANASGKFFLGK